MHGSFSKQKVLCQNDPDCRRGGSKAAAYIKISEAEIADDYPEPTQYEKALLHPSKFLEGM